MKKLLIIISIILINILYINIDFASSLQESADVFLVVIGGCGDGYLDQQFDWNPRASEPSDVGGHARNSGGKFDRELLFA